MYEGQKSPDLLRNKFCQSFVILKRKYSFDYKQKTHIIYIMFRSGSDFRSYFSSLFCPFWCHCQRTFPSSTSFSQQQQQRKKVFRIKVAVDFWWRIQMFKVVANPPFHSIETVFWASGWPKNAQSAQIHKKKKRTSNDSPFQWLRAIHCSMLTVFHG